MKVTVLCGGPSAEREISMISGHAVADGLRRVGHDVFVSDIGPQNLSALDHPADVVFPVLHGVFGESGELQDVLEHRAIPFVGSGARASRIGIDKVQTKRVWERHGLPTPEYQLITRPTRARRIDPPCVVKAVDGGSSIDVVICRSGADADRAIHDLLLRYGRVMVEKFIEGTELTVGLLEEKPLPPIRIVTRHEFFDLDAKYKDTATEHHFDLDLPEDVAAQCCELARHTNDVLGCRDLGRVDLMIDRERRPWLLEINTMPGFTPTSLLPEAAKQVGVEFPALVDRLVCRAYSRGADVRPRLSILRPTRAPRLAAG